MKELTAEQKVNIQRLSDAMRAGAAIRPQAMGILFRKQWIGASSVNKICSCALGAAWEGAHPAFDAQMWIINVDANQDIIGLNDVEIYFGLHESVTARGLETRNPENGLVTEITSVIIDLNDRACWTREEIADWLLTLV